MNTQKDSLQIIIVNRHKSRYIVEISQYIQNTHKQIFHYECKCNEIQSTPVKSFYNLIEDVEKIFSIIDKLVK